MAPFVLAIWLGLSVWGVVRAWGVRRVPQPVLAQRPNAPRQPRLRWLHDWGGWIVSSSVGSFAPALAPNAPMWLQFLLMLIFTAALLRLVYALDTPRIGHGVVAGLGLTALLLDSLSGSAWARDGALGHGLERAGVGELYGMCAVMWGLIACRAWLSMEGNPLGAAYLMGAIALWLGWKGLSPAVGWGAALAALTLSWLVVQREFTERRRVHIALQNQPTRTVRTSRGYDLALHGAILLGVGITALWLSGAPNPQLSRLTPHEGWYLGIGIVCGVGLWRRRTVRPLPPALQRAWLIATLATALLSTLPLGILALGMLLYWGLIGTVLQEISPPMSN